MSTQKQHREWKPRQRLAVDAFDLGAAFGFVFGGELGVGHRFHLFVVAGFALFAFAFFGFLGGEVFAVALVAFEAGFGDRADEEADGTDGVVVAGDDVVADVGVAVGVDEADDWDTEFFGFGDGDVFLAWI